MEHGEAVEYDLIDRGLRLRDLGKPWFSWTDLRAIVNRAETDPSMQLHRELNPDWRLTDTTNFLLAQIADVASWMRYLEMSARAGRADDVPVFFRPTQFSPDPDEPTKRDAVDDAVDDRARSVAADLRAELVA